MMTTDDRRKRERELLALILMLGVYLDEQARRLIRDDILPVDFIRLSMARIFIAHRTAAALGIGILGVRPDPWLATLIGARAADAQRQFVAGFTADLNAGRYDPQSEGGLGAKARRSRFNLYGLRLRGTANAAWIEIVKRQQVDVLWTLGAAEHCRDCIFEAGQGWRPAWSLTRVPGEGKTLCLVNCKCSLETRDGRWSLSV